LARVIGHTPLAESADYLGLRTLLHGELLQKLRWTLDVFNEGPSSILVGEFAFMLEGLVAPLWPTKRFFFLWLRLPKVANSL
jgi:hypothetical protein